MENSRGESPSILDPGIVQRLLQELESTDIDEVEVVQSGVRLYVRRDPGVRSADMPAAALEDTPGAESGLPIIAPLTGVFYGRSSPEQPAFIKEGQVVEPGMVVALIETMKLFNEVTAEFTGEVTRVLASDGDLVESGQALMYLKPVDEQLSE